MTYDEMLFAFVHDLLEWGVGGFASLSCNVDNSRTRQRNEGGFGWDGVGVERELCVMHCWRGPNHGEAQSGANLERTPSMMVLLLFFQIHLNDVTARALIPTELPFPHFRQPEKY
jgi:hypothetical protein